MSFDTEYQNHVSWIRGRFQGNNWKYTFLTNLYVFQYGYLNWQILSYFLYLTILKKCECFQGMTKLKRSENVSGVRRSMKVWVYRVLQDKNIKKSFKVLDVRCESVRVGSSGCVYISPRLLIYCATSLTQPMCFCLFCSFTVN